MPRSISARADPIPTECTRLSMQVKGEGEIHDNDNDNDDVIKTKESRLPFDCFHFYDDFSLAPI